MHVRTFLAAALALTLSAPVLAQGPMSPPDGSGPSSRDYTGYRVLYLIPGIHREVTHDQEVQIVCLNITQARVTWAVQIFRSFGNLAILCETNGPALSEAGEQDHFITDSYQDAFSISGVCPEGDQQADILVARVIVKEQKADLVCSARFIDDTSRTATADLPVTRVGKDPKIKIK